MTQPLYESSPVDTLSTASDYSAPGHSAGATGGATADSRTSQPAPSQPALSPFVQRHIGPRADAVAEMLAQLGYGSLEELISATVPAGIRRSQDLDLAAGLDEPSALHRLRTLAAKNQVWRSFMGLGYANTLTPLVIQRNVLENPGWYTQYTPYQPEIAQGRLEALLNFQTMVSDLTAMEIANASLLDEGTAAAEAMTLAFNARKQKSCRTFWVSQGCHPQTLEVVKTRAQPLGIEVVVGDHCTLTFDTPVFGLLLQYPATDG
ncbi:MAG: glycine dehydrogenase (aminomethyl-transferring), partial [Leptolyngbyaceae cyanobacterium SM2_3_12]|nr:glycine dehydrogenase (aminomethyl-transferring) [Leptolyngbyaceae cyanobacterium SM2_3_12]